MAIEKEYGKFVPVCDGCLATLDECDTFQDAVDECKNNGWQNVNINGSWQNRCPKCRAQCTQYTYKQKNTLDW